LAAIPCNGPSKKLWEKALHFVFKVFSAKSDLPLSCFQLIVANAGNVSLIWLVTLSIVVMYFSQKSGSCNFFSENYPEALKLFASWVFGSRMLLDYRVVRNCAGIFKMVTHPLFKDYLLQPMLKALLRNPDELVKGEFAGLVQVTAEVSSYFLL